MNLRPFAALCAAVLSLPIMAQSSISSAQPLQEGDNLYASTSEVFWTYTSPTDNATLLELEPLNGSSLTAYLSDGTLPAQSQVMEYYESKYYVLVGPEQKVYLSARGGYGESGAGSGFNARLEVNTNLGLGFVPEYPIMIEDGGQYMISNGTESTVDMELERYFYYEPSESGTLTFGASNYTAVRYANRNASEWQPVSGRYSTDDHLYHCDIPVNAGEPILLLAEVQAGNVSLIKTSLIPQGGGDGSTPSMAICLKDENLVPAHFGTYWFRYDATQSGFVVVSSQSSIPGGRVKFFGSSTAYPEYMSKQGTFDLRFAVTEGMSYYITVEKIETTDDETPFQALYEPAKAGDSYHYPVVLDLESTGRVEFTTPMYCGLTYNYAIDMQGPDDVFELKVRCTTPATQISDQTQLIVYPFGNMYYGSGQLYGGQALTAGTTLVTNWDLAQGNGSTVPAGRYYIYIEKYEYEPLTFVVEKVKVEAGDVLSEPIVLTETGEIEIPAKDEVYYSYTTPQPGKIVLTLDDPQLEATFYKDGNPIIVNQNGLEYSVKSTQGETYAFCIKGAGEGLYTFRLDMLDFEPGESADCPLTTDGQVVLGDSDVDVWYQYLVERDGVLVLGADLTDHDCSVGYIIDYVQGTEHPIETSIISSITDSSDLLFGAELPIHSGQIVTIHIRTSLPQPGQGVQLSVRDYELGETVENPYILTNGEKLTGLRYASRQLPTFIKVPVLKGQMRILSDLLMVGELYDAADLQHQVGMFSGANYTYDERGDYLMYYIDATVEANADYYLVVTAGGGQYAGLTLQNEASEDGIERIEADIQQRTVYDLQGRRVHEPGDGLFIIKTWK